MTETYFTEFQIGIHSQIPECCVHFFCELLQVGGEILLARTNENRRRRFPGQRFSIGYVPCSECWDRITAGLQTPTQIHICRDAQQDPICAYMLSIRKRASSPPARSR